MIVHEIVWDAKPCGHAVVPLHPVPVALCVAFLESLETRSISIATHTFFYCLLHTLMLHHIPPSPIGHVSVYDVVG